MVTPAGHMWPHLVPRKEQLPSTMNHKHTHHMTELHILRTSSHRVGRNNNIRFLYRLCFTIIVDYTLRCRGMNRRVSESRQQNVAVLGVPTYVHGERPKQVRGTIDIRQIRSKRSVSRGSELRNCRSPKIEEFRVHCK